MRTASIYSGPGYYELRGNYGSQVCFVELAPSRRQPDGRGWFKVSATAEDQEGGHHAGSPGYPGETSHSQGRGRASRMTLLALIQFRAGLWLCRMTLEHLERAYSNPPSEKMPRAATWMSSTASSSSLAAFVQP